jgi:hypothetical protein
MPNLAQVVTKRIAVLYSSLTRLMISSKIELPDSFESESKVLFTDLGQDPGKQNQRFKKVLIWLQ